MTESFFELMRDCSTQRWHLSILRDAGGNAGGDYAWRDLTWARRVDVVGPLEIAAERAGEKADITFDIRAGAPILSARAARIVRSLAADEIDLISARIDGVEGEYFVMNVLSRVKCLDEDRTTLVEKWTKDSYRPDRAGEYKRLLGIIIDPMAAAGHRLFRLWGSYSANILISQVVKEAFERENITGVNFRDVCHPQIVQKETTQESTRDDRYNAFYRQLFKPVIDIYGPATRILDAIVGFDGGGPAKVCVFQTKEDDNTAVYLTCELAIRASQKAIDFGKFEFLTICDDKKWAHMVLSRLGHLSMEVSLETSQALDFGVVPNLPGSLTGVLLEKFAQVSVEGSEYGLMRCIGITRREMEFLQCESVDSLKQRLISSNAYFVSRCTRKSVV